MVPEETERDSTNMHWVRLAKAVPGIHGGRHVLGEAVTAHRLRLLTEIICLVLKMVPQQRGGMIREQEVVYRIQGSPVEQLMAPNGEGLENLLNAIPYPT